MFRASDRSLTVLLLVFYAASLLASLTLTPLWLDEIQQFASTHHNSLPELVKWVKLDVGASPLPYLAQRVVVEALGFSLFSARLCAAIGSVLCGIVFAALCPYFLARGRVVALGMFLMLPLQFRYGVEGRVYSQGLFLSMLTLWLFLRICERPTLWLAALYCLAAAAGMYSQPLTCLPIFAQGLYLLTLPNRRSRYYGLGAAALAGLAYLPWWFAKLEVQKELHGSLYFFSLRQITPAVLLHELTGGGYASSIAMLALVFWPARAAEPKHARRRLLIATFLIAFIGPIAIDSMVPYYFAARQILFAMPALMLLGAQGYERLMEQGRAARVAAFVLAGLFIIAGAVKNFHQATVPRDDLDRTAQTILATLPSGGCILAAPPAQAGYYGFLRPQLEGRVCPDPLAPTPAILTVSSVYSAAGQRKAMADSIPPGYAAGPPVAVGQSELRLYRMR